MLDVGMAYPHSERVCLSVSQLDSAAYSKDIPPMKCYASPESASVHLPDKRNAVGEGQFPIVSTGRPLHSPRALKGHE